MSTKIDTERMDVRVPTKTKFRNVSLKPGLKFRVITCDNLSDADFQENLSRIERGKRYVTIIIGLMESDGENLPEMEIKFPVLLFPTIPAEFAVDSNDFVRADKEELQTLVDNLLRLAIGSDYHVLITKQCPDDEEYCIDMNDIEFSLVRNDNRDSSETVGIPLEFMEKILIIEEDPRINSYDLKKNSMVYEIQKAEDQVDRVAEEIESASRR